MNKILLISSYPPYYPEYSRSLGHEIHITRIMVLDMLLKNKINKDDIIVTFDDRKFLYSMIFNNIINYDQFLNLNKENYIVINIIDYTTTVLTKNIDDFNKIDYSIPETYYSNDFINLCNKIEYINLDYDFINNNFIIIHHRYNDDMSRLLNILNIIKKFNIKIIIFNNKINELKNIINIDNIDIFYTDNLQIYASLLNNNNCKLLITEWSGGGQLSQYVSNTKIIYYFQFYVRHCDYIVDNAKNREVESISLNYFGPWDFKTTTKCQRLYYKNFNDFILNLDNDISNIND
jgi:hypothetical protein